jgi:hypothetical protein
MHDMDGCLSMERLKSLAQVRCELGGKDSGCHQLESFISEPERIGCVTYRFRFKLNATNILNDWSFTPEAVADILFRWSMRLMRLNTGTDLRKDDGLSRNANIIIWAR